MEKWLRNCTTTASASRAVSCSASIPTMKACSKRTVEFVDRTKIDLPRYAVATPFPNTGLYRRLEAEGRLLHRNWSLYDVEHVVSQPKQMTPERLQDGLEWSWRQSYRWGSLATGTAALRGRYCRCGHRSISVIAFTLGIEKRPRSFIATLATWPKRHLDCE